jgi:acyl-CoA reductase-like NAD-dependent aldehyde dehydrogenase
MKINTDFVMSINGEAVTTEQTQPVFNPATRSIFAQVPDASKEQLDQTVEAAHRALKIWSATPAEERQAALEAYADLIEAHADELMSLADCRAGQAKSWIRMGSARIGCLAKGCGVPATAG